MKKFLRLFFCILLLLNTYAQAQVIRPFQPRYFNPSVRGNIVYVSNSIISTAGVAAGVPGTGELPPSGTTRNNVGTAINIDIDGVGTLPTTLIPYGSQWKFHDTVTNAVVATGRLNNWRMPAYNDAWWRTGNAVIHYGDIGTTIANNPGNATFPTTYFRKVVNIPSVAAYADFTINLRRDDGAIVYVNGVKVFADVFFASPTTHTTPATPATNIEGANEYRTIQVAASMFVNGNNTIAVEVHNQTNTATANIRDMLFDMQLLGNYMNTTFNSSSSNLNLPACSQVLFAGLYWVGDQGTTGTDTSWITGGAEKTIKFKLPGAADYVLLQSQKTDYQSLAWSTPGFVHTGYLCFRDITTLLNNSNPNGTYTSANVLGPIGIGNGMGGWTMVVAFANNSLLPRNLTVFDGSAIINLGDPPVDVNISGFLTPPTGPVSCELGAVVYDGDRSGNDAFLFKQNGAPTFYNMATTAVPFNGLNDAWNSKIAYKGSIVTSRNPAFNNTLGYDASIFEVPNVGNAQLSNNQTGATLRLSSPSENYIVHVLTTSVTQYNPSFAFDKISTDINGGAMVPGDSLRYQINYSNMGNDSSIATIITDNIPAGTTFLPGSLRINGVTKTDAVGDDQANYEIVNNRVVFRIGTGANATNGGYIPHGATGNVQFDVVVASSCKVLACVGSIRNTARIDYRGKSSGLVLFDSTGVTTSGCIIKGPVVNNFTAACYNPKDTLLTNVCPSVTVRIPWRKYAGYTIHSGFPFTNANIYNALIPVTASGTYYAYFNNGFGCSDTIRIRIFITPCPDIDDDNDGIPDYVELNNATALLDANGNGVPNWNDATYPGFTDWNIDGFNDNFDPSADSDNDGIPNWNDPTFTGYADANGDGTNDKVDKDLDGIPNHLDLDSDNDGIPDTAESYGVDANGDGLIDNYVDTDNDGFSQNVDANNTGVAGSNVGLGEPDFDGDGMANYLDTDSDNDGIPDVVEVAGPYASNNGKLSTFIDVNADGISDNNVNATALLFTGVDVAPVDGRADNYPYKNLDRDFRPNPYDLDSDADGIVDVKEAGFPDANFNGVVDGIFASNGWSATISAMPTLNLINTDAIGNYDYLDIDSDEDGIPDNIEGMSTVGYLLPLTTDADGDGLAAPYDNFFGFGGSGIFIYDHDGDGIPDYQDLDTDSDGALDICEGNDWDLNGSCNEDLTLTGLDTDGDGLDNIFDSLTSVVNVKGTSYLMGDDGSLTGDATPGTKATVQEKTNGQINRDWRFVGVVLPINFLHFSSAEQNNNIALLWDVIAYNNVERFIIERSIDNTAFKQLAVVAGTSVLATMQSFNYTDDISGIAGTELYYRIKAIGTDGATKYSEVISIKLTQQKVAVSVAPNPAAQFAIVHFFAQEENNVLVRLTDNMGKLVMLQKYKAVKGNNSLQLNNLTKYKNGVYTLQVIMPNKAITQKLVIAN
jgi:uncharacterized repeat protein (TIGR01451 family)